MQVVPLAIQTFHLAGNELVDVGEDDVDPPLPPGSGVDEPEDGRRHCCEDRRGKEAALDPTTYDEKQADRRRGISQLLCVSGGQQAEQSEADAFSFGWGVVV